MSCAFCARVADSRAVGAVGHVAMKPQTSSMSKTRVVRRSTEEGPDDHTIRRSFFRRGPRLMGDAWIYSTGAATDDLVRLLAELGFSPHRVRSGVPAGANRRAVRPP